MAEKDTAADRPAPLTLVHLEGQSADAGLCVDGLCVIPPAETASPEPGESAGKAPPKNPESSKAS